MSSSLKKQGSILAIFVGALLTFTTLQYVEPILDNKAEAQGAVIFQDSFTGSGESLSMHTPDIGSSWSLLISNGADIGATSNGEGTNIVSVLSQVSGGGSMYVANANYSSANYEITVFQENGDGSTDDPNYIACRAVDANNMYALRFSENDVNGFELFKRVAGVWTSLGSALNVPPNDTGVVDGWSVKLACEGSTIRAEVDKDDGNGYVNLLTVNDSSITTIGKAGLGMGNIGRDSGEDTDLQTLDNFTVSEISGGGGGGGGGICTSGSGVQEPLSQPSTNVTGFAWSDTVGWIHLSGSNYGVSVDETNRLSSPPGTGNLSGYAWSSGNVQTDGTCGTEDGLGWISFNASDLAGCPNAPCTARVKWDTGEMHGWARALSGDPTDNPDDIWDGWISLSCSYSGAINCLEEPLPNPLPEGSYPDYGVTVDINSGVISGFAWAEDPAGWISFNGQNVFSEYGTQTTPGGFGCYFPTPTDNYHFIVRFAADENDELDNSPTELSANAADLNALDTAVNAGSFEGPIYFKASLASYDEEHGDGEVDQTNERWRVRMDSNGSGFSNNPQYTNYSADLPSGVIYKESAAGLVQTRRNITAIKAEHIGSPYDDVVPSCVELEAYCPFYYEASPLGRQIVMLAPYGPEILSSGNYTGPYDLASPTEGYNITPGFYDIHLASYDKHSIDPDGQENEKYHLEFRNSSGSTLGLTDDTRDILDSEDMIVTYDVATDFEVTSAMDDFIAVHASGSGGQSLITQCAAFDPVDPPAPPQVILDADKSLLLPGEQTLVNWTISGVYTSCTPFGEWSPIISGSSGSASTGVLNEGLHTFGILCDGPGGQGQGTEIVIAKPNECGDGIDNDGDGNIDADDPECLDEFGVYDASIGREAAIPMPLGPICGNDKCEAGETRFSCPVDWQYCIGGYKEL